ncbi:MAG: dTDP-4-dehydrorhamnose 3,5-epimerase [Verrucomicrobiae bacterium]|nr:dTDP-4-dehydrorhamnose 3,5-epimerase [Verrucomicrobiae bacterium]NNJ43241.1 dTDP-4-dehydrorhamnose 3,5-epimerase [Akkermansiaceae bacterium]
MKVTTCRIPGVKLMELPVFPDSRGCFMPLIAERLHATHGIPTQWAETNLSVSEQGVIRGLHFQDPEPQAKLVTVVSGTIFDVALDLRPDSPTFGSFESFELSAGGGGLPNQIYLPEGLAHGFATPVGPASVVYHVSRPWRPDNEQLIPWDDERFAITWPLKNPKLSLRDGQETVS